MDLAKVLREFREYQAELATMPLPGRHISGKSAEKAAYQVKSDPSRPVLLDFETRSLADLKKVGGRVYADDPTMEVLCLVALLPDGVWVEWRRGEAMPDDLAAALHAGVPAAAHNANGFDRFIWSKLGWPEPSAWLDTLQLARASGLPGNLDDLGRRLFGAGKDKEGEKLVRSLSLPDPRSGTLVPYIPKADMDRIVAYCRRDVELLDQLWTAKLKKCPNREGFEEAVRHLDFVINSRGFAIDVKLAEALRSCHKVFVAKQARDSGVPIELLRKVKKLRDYMREKWGIVVAKVDEETIQQVLKNPDVPDEARRVLRARLAVAKTSFGKLNRALSAVGDDGRLRDTLVYCGAHTGRFAGRGFNPHNLPGGVRLRATSEEGGADAAIERLAQSLLEGDPEYAEKLAGEMGVKEDDLLATLVRGCIIPAPGKVLVVADFAQIEARIISWVAGDSAALDRYRQGKDFYREMAGHLFGKREDAISSKERSLGKALILGCGFQMGAKRFEEYAEKFGVSWDALQLTPRQCVEAYRDANPLIAGTRTGKTYTGAPCRRGGLWKALNSAAEAAVLRGRKTQAGLCTWYRAGNDLCATLPSGRTLVYPQVKYEYEPRRRGNSPTEKPRRKLSYATTKGKRAFMYGGKFAENIVQAMARDVLVESLMRCEAENLPVILHVHDENVLEVSVAQAESVIKRLLEIMETTPKWAEGLPLKAEGFIANRYRK